MFRSAAALLAASQRSSIYCFPSSLTAFTDWAPLAQDRAGWHKLVTEPPFKLGKPFVRQPRGDTRVTPEDMQRLAEQRAAEIAERRVRR